MLNKLTVTWAQVFPKGAYLASVHPLYKFVGNKRSDEQLGWYYNFVNRSGYEIIPVKVFDKNPIISQQEIDDSLNDISVIAEGFTGSLYNKDGKIKISATAEKVVIK